MAYEPVTEAEVEATEGLDGWRVVRGELQATFTARSFAAAGTLVAAIAQLADALDHHPDVALRYPGQVEVHVSTHAIGGLSTHDVELARRVSVLAATLLARTDTG